MLANHFKDFPKSVVEKFTWKNASELFRIDVPMEIRSNPDAF